MKRLLGPVAKWARLAAQRPLLLGLLLVCVVGGSTTAWLLHRQHLTFQEALNEAAGELGLRLPGVSKAPTPTLSRPDIVMDGSQRQHHPRILLPQLRSWDGRGVPGLFKTRAAAYRAEGIRAPSPCVNNGLLGDTACWLVSGDADAGRRALRELRRFHVTKAHASGDYGNAWKLALAYDLLALSPELSSADRNVVDEKLTKALREDLVLLDGGNASLWHGRTTLAATAWLCAIALDPATKQHLTLIRRAHAHFLDVMQALALVEAWPEGYNYWIQNRALLLALAGSAYVNGLRGATHAAAIRDVLNRVGLWTVYATRPDNRIEGFGDEGSRVDLKDSTRRVIDIISQLTGDPVLSTYSRYLGKIGGSESYYAAYRWGFWLFNDPRVQPLATVPPGALKGLGRILPRAAIFGQGAMNMAYMRSGWAPDDTFISFHAGDIFTHHGHYDAGHFTLFKGAPLAVNSSTYGGGFMSPNRLDYSIRTVAKNSLLIMRPGERVQPNRFFSKNVAGGGQRIVLPTGSAIRSVRDWRRNLDKALHLQAGKLLHFESIKGRYAYIAADLTDAYNTPQYDQGGSGGKVASVRRSLLYIYGEDRLIVFDDVVSTEKSYVKKWLMHTVEEPRVNNLVVLTGSAEDGILQSQAHEAVVHNGDAYLDLRAVYPRDSIMRLVGGPDFRYYVDVDGDDRTFDGGNFSQGAKQAWWFDGGLWRIELQSARQRKRVHFLVILSPSLHSPRRSPAAPLNTNSRRDWAVSEPRSVVIFAKLRKNGRLKFTTPGGQKWLYLVGMPRRADVLVEIGKITGRHPSSRAGVVFAPLPGIPGRTVTVKWQQAVGRNAGEHSKAIGK